MVVLASKPMGLPAVWINKANPDVRMIGISHCFLSEDNCANQFFHYRLGKNMRDAIDGHEGPLYVAYPSDKNPGMSQLALFGVRLDPEHCQVMRTNVTRKFNICHASKTTGGIGASRSVPHYKLAVDTTLMSSFVHVSTQWWKNVCGWETVPGKLRIQWSVRQARRPIHVSVESTDGSHRLLARSPRLTGTVSTGAWVNARQTYVIKDAEGKALAQMAVHYRPCMN
jgi:hypothetical protein